MRVTRAFLLVSLLAAAPPAYAQETCTQLIAEATDAYRLGRLDDVLARTDECLGRRPSPGERERVYALRANVFLATDQLAEAESAAKALLGANPDFAPAVDDSDRLRTLVVRIRRELARDGTSSVSKMNESLLEAPATVIVVTADQIRRRGYRDLEAVLHDLPGFDISRTNGQTYSNIYQRGYRSDATNRTLFMVDGVEQNDLFSNIAYISRQYALSNIDRVEVVYGPASTMYGANAFLGVINVITRDPDDILADARRVTGEAYVGGGSWNTSYVDGTMAGRVGGATFSLTARRFQSDEFDLGRFDQWSYDYGLSRYRVKFDKFENALPSLQNLVSRARVLDRPAFGTVNGAPLGYSDLTRDWLVSGKLKVREFLFGAQVWQTREGAAASSTKWTEPGARNGNIWVPSQASMYARYTTAVSGNLRLTYFGQAKVHELQPESSAFLLNSYASGPLGVVELAFSNPEPSAFWQQSYVAQSSNQLRNEMNLVYRPRDALNVVGGVDLRNGSIQSDYSKSANCTLVTLGEVKIPSGIDPARVLDFTQHLTDQEIELIRPFENQVSNRAGQFLSYEEADRSRCTRQAGSIATPVTGEEHLAVRELGLFAQASYRATRNIKLVAGWRVDNGGVDLRQGYGTVSTPRFAFVYAPGDFAIKAIYAEAFKDPSSLERYSTIPGIRESASKDLRPERARNVEVSIGRQTPALSADVAVYRASYTDVIGVKESNLYRELNGNASNHFSNRLAECWYFTLISLTDCFVQALQPVGALESRQRIADRFFNEPALKLSFANLATIDVWGAQANGSWRRGGVELAGNYSYVHPEAAAGDSGEQRRVRDIASHRVNVIASGTWRRVDASLRVNVVGSRFTPVENDPLGLLAYLESQGQRFRFAEPLESIAPPLPDELKNDLKRYVVANVAAGYELLPGIAVQAVVENLFDTVYADPGVQTADNVRFAARIPQPGRSLFVRLQTRF